MDKMHVKPGWLQERLAPTPADYAIKATHSLPVLHGPLRWRLAYPTACNETKGRFFQTWERACVGKQTWQTLAMKSHQLGNLWRRRTGA